jgi:hypothetical protein
MRDDPWDRASFDANVKPEMAIRDISRRDLLIPKGPGKLRMLGLTSSAAWRWRCSTSGRR